MLVYIVNHYIIYTTMYLPEKTENYRMSPTSTAPTLVYHTCQKYSQISQKTSVTDNIIVANKTIPESDHLTSLFRIIIIYTANFTDI